MKPRSVLIALSFASLSVTAPQLIAHAGDEYVCDYYELPMSNDFYGATVYDQSGAMGKPVDVLTRPEFGGEAIDSVLSGDSIQVLARLYNTQVYEADESCTLWYLIKKEDDNEPLGWVFAISVSLDTPGEWE